MEVINFGAGITLILMGVLVFNYNYFIPGYNNLSDEQKKKIDVKGLKSFMRPVLILMGVLIIVDYYILRLMGYPVVADYISFPIIILGGMFIGLNAVKFFKK